jgi:drug/metabolite transporter (DMT)-like permease
MKNDRLVSWGIFILLCIIWGSSFILMKASKDELTWAQIASLRIFLAGVVMLPFAFFYFFKFTKKADKDRYTNILFLLYKYHDMINVLCGNKKIN